MKTFIFIVVITGLGFFIPFLIKLNKESKKDNAAEANRVADLSDKERCLEMPEGEEKQQCLFDNNLCPFMEEGEKKVECFDIQPEIDGFDSSNLEEEELKLTKP